jgi:hypothetical protein
MWVDYLEMLSKPCQKTIEAFVNCIKVMVWDVDDNMPFPGPYPLAVNQTNSKNIIFCAMLSTWQMNFLHVNDVSTSFMLNLQHFMSQER